MIRILDSKDINHQRWNECVANSHKPDVYALTWFLDIVLPSWKGAVWGDYEFVMPLYTKKKWGLISVFKTPFFVKELAVYPERNAPHREFADALKAYYNSAWLKDLTVSSKLHEQLGLKGEEVKFQKAKSWKQDEVPTKELRKNLSSFALDGSEIRSISFQEHKAFVVQYSPYPVAHQAWSMLEMLSKKSEFRMVGVWYEGELIAVQMLALLHGTIFFFQNATHVHYRKSKVMPWLMHLIVATEPQAEHVHFMGSNNEAVAIFNKKFGAHSEVCFRLVP